jgi:2-(1,2-epoxy-1,2-dihydrophenyl)acetyl-CoA isomerase
MADLLVNRDNDVLTLTLNRPDVMNALSEDMKQGLIREFQTEMAAPSVRAILITGSGRGFCTGADLDLTTILDRRPLIEGQVKAGVNQLIKLMRDIPIPVVAAVNGAAAGAGFSLALASDFILAAQSAKFHLSFAKIGAVMDGGMSSFLTHKIGAARTTSLAMLGGSIDAETAFDWGLAFNIVEDEELMADARKLAQRLASGPTRSLGLIKAEIEAARTASLEDSLRLEARSQHQAFNTDDFEEGVTAFTEKRKAEFKGR